MSRVAVLGAGPLGGAVARALAVRDRFGEVRLIDPAGSLAAGKALDIRQSAPIEGFGTRVTASEDPAAALGSTLVVLADAAGLPAAEWTDDAALRFLKLLASDRRGLIVAAGAGHRTLIDRAARELAISPRRMVGSAPGALVAALRALIALETGASPADVSITLLGTPPGGTVVAWSDAAVGGQALTSLLPPPALARLEARVAHLWPPGPFALASAAAAACEALAGRSRRQLCCFVTLDGEFGARGVTSAAPVILGPAGLERIVAPALSGQERVRLENALGL